MRLLLSGALLVALSHCKAEAAAACARQCAHEDFILRRVADELALARQPAGLQPVGPGAASPEAEELAVTACRQTETHLTTAEALLWALEQDHRSTRGPAAGEVLLTLRRATEAASFASKACAPTAREAFAAALRDLPAALPEALELRRCEEGCARAGR